jgi:hypothetical protein
MLGEIALITVFDHAFDHLGLERTDGADPAEGGHGAAQLVGLAGREAAGDDGDVHRLLLEQRHAQRLASTASVPAWETTPAPALSAAQVGMDHVALDRAGADNRHLDDQIVIAARPEARQHRHLRPAFDLEDADGVGAADHVIGGGSPSGSEESVSRRP